MGEGVQQRGNHNRFGEAYAGEGAKAVLADKMNSGADLVSWLGQNRRISNDYERLPESGEAFIYVAMSRLMARRLAR
jgi:transposase